MAILNKSFSTQKYEVLYYVEESHHSSRLDHFLQNYLTTWSREDIKRIIKDGNVKILKRPSKHRPSSIVHYKDQIKMSIPRTTQEDEYWNNQLIKLVSDPQVIFEDNNLIALSKPPYMSTHPTGRHLFYCATVYFEELYKSTIHSIHRLDRETSGLLLLGKNSTISRDIGKKFIKNEIKKCYFFIAKKNDNYNNISEFDVTLRLGQSDNEMKRVCINYFPSSSTQGKEALTKFKIIYNEGDYVLGLAFPTTGRQHQIRVHALSEGLPLLGDKLYLGSYKIFQRFKDNLASIEDHQLMELNRQALHSIAIGFEYNDKYLILKSHLPLDLTLWINEKLKIKIKDLEDIISKEIKNYFKSFSR